MLFGWIGFNRVTIFIMEHHESAADCFFKYVTAYGEWPIISLSILSAILVWRWTGLVWGIAFAMEGFVINGLKLYFNCPRPSIDLHQYIHRIDGIELAQWKSFPSGHTAAVFFGTFLLIHLLRDYKSWKKTLVTLLLVLAYLVAYSRIYLGQHHIQDVLFGAFLGIFIFQLFSVLIAKLNIR